MPSSLMSAVEDVLQQGCTLLRSVSPAVYASRGDDPSGSSIGAHYRHVLDHFLCLREGIQTGQINYDRRRRDSELENSPQRALTVTQQLMAHLTELSPEILQRECTVVYSVGYGDAEAQGAPSNLTREMMFCVGHTIHHYAILKLLCTAAGVRLPREFGIAPSTLKHLETAPAGRG